jgi:hypothetical protein
MNTNRFLVGSRRCSLTEIIIYVTTWALLLAVWSNDVLFSLFEPGAVLAPGPLIGGGVAFAVAGRRWFVTGLVGGFVAWMLILIRYY